MDDKQNLTPQLIDQKIRQCLTAIKRSTASLNLLIGLRKNLIRMANDEIAGSDEPVHELKLFRSMDEYQRHRQQREGRVAK